ncbi:hypothetical protein SU69_02085 [Thermosipho melanesiensis]|uniref:Uncharacterized protein n=2 Tax=Thermosipho melanesiensis TaxID=46541 RepID=A6LK18_THEM4|nr:hypothetical protein [Thermosipho melanesiensis]ABR30269.1 hypothetical protein Tmel_0400 [Thermosipho melanesiensis BI429]APT74814.1 hypothetical protein BW47_02175 [Thermosipho melanesiensis]OOC37395.1 hypothetical protein SU68_02095 [Thermosipho melanesiensis]OOC39757.1 hypothetical protein SU69_02085 [Thermosipho melanesiensis]OOC39862.1 hypothetical protein SU70_02080 [Thermosipho melanesiensis]
MLIELRSKQIVLLDDYYEKFIITPEDIDISACDEDEITLYGDRSLGSFTIRLSDGELIGIDGYKL